MSSKIENVLDIAKRLNDGIERTSEEMDKCVEWLTEYMVANDLTLKQLDDLCFENSVWVFDQIFA